jgi:mono/diheme cytochrome c family protein
MLKTSGNRLLAIVFAAPLTVWLSAATPTAQPQATATKTVWDGVYSEAQANRGAAAYRAACSSCHRADLSGYNGVLRGQTFIDRWREDNVNSLYTNIKTTMPRNNPGILKPEMYLDIVAFLLQQNAFPAADAELQPDALKNIKIVGMGGAEALPAGALAQTFGCITAGPDNTWLLTRATAPARTRNPEKSSDEDLKAAQSVPAGTQTFRLIDAAFYHPERHKDERVEAKGFLMKDPTDGLSLTSLTTVSGTCP